MESGYKPWPLIIILVMILIVLGANWSYIFPTVVGSVDELCPFRGYTVTRQITAEDIRKGTNYVVSATCKMSNFQAEEGYIWIESTYAEHRVETALWYDDFTLVYHLEPSAAAPQ